MKTTEHSTSKNQPPMPKESVAVVWEFNDGQGPSRKFDLEDSLLEFASAVIDLSESLRVMRSGNHIAGQILRSGTSPYANHGEAEAAESRDDFIHKMKICLKELRETRRWARLIKRKAWVKNEATLQFILSDGEELIRIFHSSIQTAIRNRKADARKPSNPVSYDSREAG